MSQLAPDREIKSDRLSGYRTSMEHLADELRRLDLLIHLKLLKHRKPASLLDQFKGLVLSEEEISELLASPAICADIENTASPNPAEEESLFKSLSHLDSQIEQRQAISLKDGINLSLLHVSRLFRLTRFEERCLLVCLAPEIDRKYEKLYSYLQDDITRKTPCADLLLDLLCNTFQEKLIARQAFDPGAPLLKHGLLQMTSSLPSAPMPLLSCPIKLDDRIANILLGFGQMDARIESLARLVYPQEDCDPRGLDEGIRSRTLNFIHSHFSGARHAKQNLVFYFHGPYGAGTGSLTRSICRELGLLLIMADVERILSEPLGFKEAIRLIGREALLQPAALCLENFDLLANDDKRLSEIKSLAEVISTFCKLTFLLGDRSWKPRELFNEHVFIDLKFSVPDENARNLLWQTLAREHIAEDVNLGALASKFRLTPGQIQDALKQAQNLALWRSPEDGKITAADLDAACRAQSNPKLGSLAHKIDARYEWNDIVLSRDQHEQITEICNQARLRHIVYGEWGFDRKLSLGKGLNALFSGPPGTGKTMAAEVIANELRLDLYKIDLSQVVSKYIGETEKNLHQIFHEAQSSSAILFFDEADALFGKRSEVKDAHDRYANIEIGYLLQKMEEYDGVAILATNLRQNMDDAFVRRMHCVIEFPFPDEEFRQRIWKVIFPTEAPLASDVDFAALAREIRLAGGNIKNIALAAAFYAASDGKVIRMSHLIQAARREYQKLGRTWNEAEWITQGRFIS
ncbi:MAG TPA: ATP-binding protein [Blastocatellia bacterium]|nr:ATP-binding protein [Blastocatellia bacterium]